jgi:hypothetical protein
MPWIAKFRTNTKQFPSLEEALNSISKALIATSDYTNDCDSLRWCFSHIDEVENSNSFQADKWSVQKIITK